MEHFTMVLKLATLFLCVPSCVLSIVTFDKEAITRECDPDTPMVLPNFKANWFKATEYCHFLGRNLVIVTSAEKQDSIAKVIELTDKAGGDSSFWIGGSDLAELGNFHWHSTGSRFVWNNWNELYDMPSAADSRNRKEERCVLLSPYSGDGGTSNGYKWTVVNCWEEYYFVCEKGVFMK